MVKKIYNNNFCEVAGGLRNELTVEQRKEIKTQIDRLDAWVQMGLNGHGPCTNNATMERIKNTVRELFALLGELDENGRLPRIPDNTYFIQTYGL